ncbi:MAG: hypothetical protein ACRDRC_15010, partial [Pseudonocardiaceae bacterium]
MEHDDTNVPVVRKQDFECAGPIDVSVELDSGRLDIQLEQDTEGAGRSGVAVQVRADPTGQPPWTAGI